MMDEEDEMIEGPDDDDEDVKARWEFDDNGLVGGWGGENWLAFPEAMFEIRDKLVMPIGPAEAQLRELCANGKVRAITLPWDENEEPKQIPPGRWRTEDLDWGDTIPAVNKADFR
jgi:hypothetical protein